MSEQNENNNESDEYLFRDLSSDNNQVEQNSIERTVNEYNLNDRNAIDEVDRANGPDYPNDEEKTKLGVISLILLGVSMIGPGVFSKLLVTGLESINGFYTGVESLCGFAGIVSFVLMIITRVRYPKDRAGKVAMWLFIAGFILTALSIILLIVACTSCASSLRGF